MTARLRQRQVAVLLALLLAGCAQPGREPAPAPIAATAPATEASMRQFYETLAAQGRPVYRVAGAQSLVVITVRRGGSLARLGHDHVVASHAVQGWIAPDAGRADLRAPLAELAVDEPALRDEAGLDTRPSASDIAATRANLLDKVLDVQRFPYALIRVASATAAAPGVRLDVELTLRGLTRSFAVPALVKAGGDTLEVGGSFEFDQSSFGIVPFSILGGAVQVQDRLSLRFAIRALRVARPGELAD
ncbi:YceI family protein [Variovorax saccharolyticus]|uniref:YceI family protein n=1 Tax=Variovorax saccharolyticus TaxID=3053516 RepID=UPI0025768217|nr:YceI family protein [Variovorax sp. J22R187]MDM0016778.1 YceI family protein [Variovorax sp. J22R187]